MDEALLAQKANPEKWSKKEILGHLVDSAYNNHQRFLRAATQDNLRFSGYDQMKWVAQNGYQERSLKDLLQLWCSAQTHLALAIDRLPEALLNKVVDDHNFHQICMNRVPADEPTTLSYLVSDYIFHLEHHLSQIIPDYERLLP